MLSTPSLVQSQLSEALSVICSHDFPVRWPTLLPELVERLTSSYDLHVINGVLATANSIFKRYRNKHGTNELVQELESSQNMFAGPLLDTLKKLSRQIPACLAEPVLLRQLLSSVRYVCRIFFSLNAPGLTPVGGWVGLGRDSAGRGGGGGGGLNAGLRGSLLRLPHHRHHRQEALGVQWGAVGCLAAGGCSELLGCMSRCPSKKEVFGQLLLPLLSVLDTYGFMPFIIIIIIYLLLVNYRYCYHRTTLCARYVQTAE